MPRRRDEDDNDEDTRPCPFCHTDIPVDRYRRHIDRHQKEREDGQMRDHVTLPPSARRKGRLDDVPQVYCHEKCGEETVMPEEIVRSYLENPFLYNDRTFCCGCEKYVRHAECYWTETGQPLDEYFEDLKDEAVHDGRGPKPTPAWVLIPLFAIGAGFGLCIAGAKVGGGGGAVAGGVLGFFGGATAGVVVWLTRKPVHRPRPDRDFDDDDDEDEDDRPRRRSSRRRRDDYDD